MISSLIALLLVWLNESEAYVVMHKMIDHSMVHNRDENCAWHLTFRKWDYSKFLAAFSDLVKRDLRQLAYHFNQIDFDLPQFCTHWFGCFFVGYLNTSFVTRILQVYLSEGVKFLFQVGLVLLKDLDSELRKERNPLKIPNKIRNR